MSVGIVEVITFLLTLGGFGIDANPKAPTAAEVLRFAPDGADAMLHIDLAAFVPRNYQALVEVPKRPGVAGTEIGNEIAAGVGKIAMGIGVVKTMTGVDVTTDLHSLTAWVRMPDAGAPEVLVVVRGNLPTKVIDRLADKVPTKKLGEVLVLEPEAGMVVGRAHDGSIVAGSEHWVTPRLARSWKPVKVKSGAGLRGVSSVLAEKPFLAVVTAPSTAARRRLTADLDRDEQILTDLVDGHELAAVYLTHDGLGWQWNARDAAGAKRAELASRGLIEVMRAVQHGSRGVVDLTFATLPSYRHLEPVAAVLDKETEIRALLAGWMGDGEFRARVRSRGKSVMVSARGDSLSEVAPAALFAVLGGAGYFLASSEPEPPMQELEGPVAIRATPATTDPRPQGLDLRGSFERARQRVDAAAP